MKLPERRFFVKLFPVFGPPRIAVRASRENRVVEKTLSPGGHRTAATFPYPGLFIAKE